MDRDARRVGLRLQYYRKLSGWKSAKAYADHIGMSARTYTSYEQGEKNLYLDVAARICRDLGIPVDKLVGDG